MPKTDRNITDDQALDAFFDAMKTHEVAPSDRLVAAILDDAAQHQPQAPDLPPARSPYPAPRRSRLRDVLDAIGGWPAMAGMTTAAIAGLWLGLAAPTGLETLSGGLILSSDASLSDGSFALEDMAPDHLATSFLTEDDG